MAEMAKGAVDSVLGTIGAAIGERAALMGSVRRDMRFIKGEMESMNGFLLDVDDPVEQSNQVQAWMRQVRDVAYDSQSCIDRYVQTVGAGRSSAGLLGSVGRAPQVLRTLPDRYRIAMQIKEIKSRAQEVGERRQRYGVQALTTIQARGGAVGGGDTKEAEEDAAAAGRRRRVLADFENLLDADAREVMAWVTRRPDHRAASPSRTVAKFIAIMNGPTLKAADLGSQLATTARELLGDGDPENIADASAIMSNQGAEITDKEMSALVAGIKKLLGFRQQHQAKSKGATPTPKPPVTAGQRREQNCKEVVEIKPATPTPETTVDPLELLKLAPTVTDVANAEKQYSDQLTEWLRQVFKTDIIEELVLGSDWLQGALTLLMGNHWVQEVGKAAPGVAEAAKKQAMKIFHSVSKQATGTPFDFLIKQANAVVAPVGDSIKDLESHFDWLKDILPSGSSLQDQARRPPRLLAIVTPPVDVPNPEDEKSNAQRPATKLARSVYEISSKGQHFYFVAWIDAKLHAGRTQRLQCLLQQVQLHPSSGDDQVIHLQEQMNTWSDEELAEKIQAQLKLKGKKFLIVLADHEDQAPWQHISSALPPCGKSDSDDESGTTIIVTPVVQQSVHFHGWYLASWLFLLRASHYKVHFYSHLEATSKIANELLVGGHASRELQSIVKRILQQCHWDTFSTRLFLRALYANPRRSENELMALLHRLQDFGTVSVAGKIINFCYQDLPSHYKPCLQYLSMFPQDTGSGNPIKRGSLLRRWAAENLITTRNALDEAERGLNALVERGLVLLSDTGPQGKAKTCSVPHEFFSFISNKMTRGDTRMPRDLAPRLSIHDRKQLQQLFNRGQWAHSNMCWRMLNCATASESRGSEDPLVDIVVFLNSLPASSRLGLIKVLDLERCRGLDKQKLGNIFSKIFQLKYLSLRNTGVQELPKEICKLQDLETLDIRETKIKSLPVKADEFQKLVHLLAGNVHHDGTRSHEPVCTVHMPRGIGSMPNIQVLSHVEIADSVVDVEVDDVGQLQQLRKLGVVIPSNKHDAITRLLQVLGKLDECLCSLSVHIEPEDEVDMNTKPEQILFPRSLQCLYISGKILGLPNWIKKLHRLSRITLCRTSLKATNIEILGNLMNLRILVLGHDSYGDSHLTFKKKEFKQLELLVVDGSQICKINFDLAAAPKLEKIVWTSTSTSMDMYGIDKLSSLRQIKLNGSFNAESIKQAMCKNPNNPTLRQLQIPDDTIPTIADANLIPGSR